MVSEKVITPEESEEQILAAFGYPAMLLNLYVWHYQERNTNPKILENNFKEVLIDYKERWEVKNGA